MDLVKRQDLISCIDEDLGNLPSPSRSAMSMLTSCDPLLEEQPSGTSQLSCEVTVIAALAFFLTSRKHVYFLIPCQSCLVRKNWTAPRCFSCLSPRKASSKTKTKNMNWACGFASTLKWWSNFTWCSPLAKFTCLFPCFVAFYFSNLVFLPHRNKSLSWKKRNHPHDIQERLRSPVPRAEHS